MFLGKYKLMLGSDCKLIYGTADYHRKRLKVLESERYIRRVNRLYIKLDDKGTRLVKEFGYDYSYKCFRSIYISSIYNKLSPSGKPYGTGNSCDSIRLKPAFS